MLTISSQNFSITEAIRAEVDSVGDTINNHLDTEQNIKVRLSKSAPDVFTVHLQSHFRGVDIFSEHSSHDFHKALELAKDHMIKQMDKRRDKLNKR